MKINQGDIFWANLNPTKGHEQSGLRPVIILQNNILNKNLSTIIIAPITTNLKAKGLLTTYLLDKKFFNLSTDSIILLYQIRTIDKIRLEKLICNIGHSEFVKIKEQLSFVF